MAVRFAVTFRDQLSAANVAHRRRGVDHQLGYAIVKTQMHAEVIELSDGLGAPLAGNLLGGADSLVLGRAFDVYGRGDQRLQHGLLVIGRPLLEVEPRSWRRSSALFLASMRFVQIATAALEITDARGTSALATNVVQFIRRPLPAVPRGRRRGATWNHGLITEA